MMVLVYNGVRCEQIPVGLPVEEIFGRLGVLRGG